MNARVRQIAGFTLIEIMLAMVTITFAIVGLLAVQMTSLHANQRARELSEATQLCQEKVEQLRYGPLPLPTPPSSGELLDSRGCLVTGDPRAYCLPLLPGQRYTRTWVIDTSMQNRFEVRTSWTGADGQIHMVTVAHVR